ncbi:hypothetical protein ACFFRS_27630, partial [Saccharopolyspora hordei]|uniref:hypothetical protein n=1 Tax=Saccharopolyspora hordei TaxID=1838 RepID=UPI0035EC7BEA
MGVDARGNRRLVKHLSADDWIVDEHRTKDGAAVLPGTGYLDLAAQALRAQGETGAFEINDLYFFRAVSVPEQGSRELRATLVRNAEGYEFSVRSDVIQGGAKGFVLNAQAQLGMLQEPAPTRLDLAAIAARCGAVREGQGMASPQEAHLNFGLRWRVLNRVASGSGEGLAQ